MATKAAVSTTEPLTTQQAAAAIVELLNARPTTPRQDEIEAIIARIAGGPALSNLTAEQSTRAAAVRAVIVDMRRAEKAMGAQAYREGLEESHGQSFDRLEELAQRIPRPVRSLADVIMLAGVVWAYDDKNEDGSLRNLESDCPDERARARLVEAVLTYAGTDYR